MKNENGLQTTENISPEIIQNLVLQGDISKMSQNQKVEYYNRFCQSLGLNPLTQPFQIIKFQGKERLYATKDCTEQLRKIHGVSITEITSQRLEDVYVVTAKAKDKEGKVDASTGAVVIGTTKGEALANALMKAETKAKRRVTLSICGLGMLDEIELDTMPNHVTKPIEETEAIEVKQEPDEKISKEVLSDIIKQVDTTKTSVEVKETAKIWLDDGLKRGLTPVDSEVLKGYINGKYNELKKKNAQPVAQ